MQYKKLLLVTLAINVFMFILEVLKVVELILKSDILSDGAAILSVVATCLTFWNIVVLVRLYRHPVARAALVSGALIMFLLIIYVAQCIVYYHNIDQRQHALPVICIFLFAQLLSGILLYRFWEFILFNYDDDQDPDYLADDFGYGVTPTISSPVSSPHTGSANSYRDDVSLTGSFNNMFNVKSSPPVTLQSAAIDPTVGRGRVGSSSSSSSNRSSGNTASLTANAHMSDNRS